MMQGIRKHFGKGLILVLFVFFLTTIAIVASAASSGTCGSGVNWALDDEGTLTISGSGFMTSHPWKNDEYYDDYSIKKVVITNGVQNICDDAFSYCRGLVSITLPDSIKGIGASAFFNCQSLTAISIPNGVMSIDQYTFSNCESLRDVVIPGSITKIGRNAFSECKSLLNISIPDGVSSIDDNVFSGCSQLNNIKIPEAVTYIGYGAFYSCSSLTSVIIPGKVITIGGNAFEKCYSINEVTILNYYTFLGNDAFKDCLNLQKVVLPGFNEPAITELKKEGYESKLVYTTIDINNMTIRVGYDYSNDEIYYTGSPLEPNVEIYYDKGEYYDRATLKLNIDYSLTFENNTNVGTATVIATGKGNFTGTIRTNFEIKPCNINNTLIDYIGYHDYTGSAIRPDVNITYNGKKLNENTDYTVSYSNNINAGQAIATVNGINNFTGTCETSFTIYPVGLYNCKYYEIKDQVYTGKAIKPKVTLKYKGKNLKNGKDYTVTYKKNKAIGSAFVTIKGKGNFSGTLSRNFLIIPKPVKISSLKTTANNIEVNWTKGKNIDGYEIQYDQNKKFINASSVTIPKASTTKTLISYLMGDQKYYVRIRAYKYTNSYGHVYSAWSAVKSIKTKTETDEGNELIE